MMLKQVGDTIWCGTEGCFGMTLEACPECDTPTGQCACGCESFDCDCPPEQEEIDGTTNL